MPSYSLLLRDFWARSQQSDGSRQPSRAVSTNSFTNSSTLTAQQEDRLDRLEERYAIENAQRELAVRRANANLAAAMDKEHEYGPEVSLAIDEVHQRMGELQKATVRHVFAMRRILDQEQQREFDQQVARSLTGSPSE